MNHEDRLDDEDRFDEQASRVVETPRAFGEFLIIVDVEYRCIRFRTHRCLGTAQSIFVPEYAMDGDDPDHHWDARTTDSGRAAVFLSGKIDYVGCINLNFMLDATGPAHFCGRAEAACIGKLIDKLYDMAATLIPSWEADLAE